MSLTAFIDDVNHMMLDLEKAVTGTLSSTRSQKVSFKSTYVITSMISVTKFSFSIYQSQPQFQLAQLRQHGEVFLHNRICSHQARGFVEGSSSLTATVASAQVLQELFR